MSFPRVPECSPPPPVLFDYDTWRDEDGYHARFRQRLPRSALAYGCLQDVHAATALEMTNEAARNRIRVWAWEATPKGVAS